MRFETSDIGNWNELSLDAMERVCGAGLRIPVFAGAKQLGSGGTGGSGGSGPHRQPIDPPSQLGTDYSGDSAGGGGGSGGYMGDGDYLHPF